MARKCRGISDIAVMEVAQVGVRTRARASLAMAAAAASSATTTKRRKLRAEELKCSSSSSSSSFEKLRRRRRLAITTEATEERRFSSPSSDHDAASCCSSNGSSLLLPEEERIEFVDLQDGSSEVETSTYSCCRERRETTPSSELRPESAKLEPTERPTEADSRPSTTVEKKIKMIPEAELEEFFAAAERDMHKHFMEKYNFDFVNEVPLEGRYEWVRLKP
ncbi:cyclin-dependent kinase inhibitor 7-like [Juglans microcarpa x Juglans regia]|uniref:cyclin-dependent kinase inhibitor 7-like n=1 Tax=Juglans microcarpa x Juglans regia TaxID=2249226 RepID=UPI001B7E351E|nr:cyclin-dependent kinase inhibitor 7-like [Juglans microcarpa x Juglans regia]